MTYLQFNTMVKLKNMMVVFLVLSVILIAGCSTSENDDGQDVNDFIPDDSGATDTPTGLVTGDVVAVVNDEEIKSEEVIEVQQTFMAQGQEVSEDEALEQVIIQKVLEQKVREEDLSVSTEEAEAMIEQQLSMQGATLEDYKEQIESQGVSYDDEIENVKNQMAIQMYLDTQMEDLSFNVSDVEAQEFYEMYKAQSPEEEELPSYEELEPQIMMTLEQQKQQEATNVFIQELLESAVIEYK